MPIAAVLFDVDGTLLDTEAYIFGAFDAALASAGLPSAGAGVYREVVGHPLEGCYRRLAPGCDVSALCETHRSWQMLNIHLVKPMPGAHATLEALRRAGMQLAAVTNRSRRSSLASLERAMLLASLDTVVSSEDVARQKPDPEPLRLALDRLGVPPEAAVMVGDTVVDIAAGRAAGMRAIGVSFGFCGPGIATAGPDAVAHALGEVPALVAGW